MRFTNLFQILILCIDMLLWVLQTSILSLLFICMIHYLIEYLKKTFTVPKKAAVMDEQMYEKIYKVVMQGQGQGQGQEEYPTDVTLLDELPVEETTMKEELKQFLKEMDY